VPPVLGGRAPWRAVWCAKKRTAIPSEPEGLGPLRFLARLFVQPRRPWALVLVAVSACADQEVAVRWGSDREVFTPVLSLGREEGPSHHLFGRIEDVAFGEDGSIVILDSRPPSVRVFSKHGAHQASWEARGRRPGELIAPFDVEVGEAGRIVVADRAKRSLVIFAPGEGELLHLGDIRIPGLPRAFCLTGDTALVVVDADLPLIKIRLLGGQVESLPVLGEQNPLAKGSFSEARLACPNERGGLAWATRFSGHLRFLGRDGTITQNTSLPGFRALDTVTVGRRFVQSVPRRGFSSIDFVGWLDDSTLVVQETRHPQPGILRSAAGETVTYLIRPASVLTRTFRNWPRAAALGPGVLAEVENDSIPIVTVFSRHTYEDTN